MPLSRYDLIEDDVAIQTSSGPRIFRITRVKDINALVDAMGPEDFGPDERLPYWATLWPSAIVLARVLLDAPRLAGPVLELGAGLGLVSIAAATRGVETTAADYEPDALSFIARNAAQNGVEVSTRLWDWRAPPPQENFQTIVAADVLYEARNVPPVASAIAALVRRGGIARISDPKRPHFGAFRDTLRANGLTVDVEETDGIVVMTARQPPAS